MDGSSAQADAAMESSFNDIFAKADSTAPFTERMTARLLLYPIDYTQLDRQQFGAVSSAARRCGGEAAAYFAGYGEASLGFAGTYGRLLLDLDNYDAYSQANPAGPLEHFLFSPRGDWGLVTSDGQYALVGGDQSFINAVRRSLRQDDEAVIQRFSADWASAGKAGAATDWVPTLLRHLGRNGWPGKDSC